MEFLNPIPAIVVIGISAVNKILNDRKIFPKYWNFGNNRAGNINKPVTCDLFNDLGIFPTKLPWPD